jgi:hypothetical protein
MLFIDNLNYKFLRNKNTCELNLLIDFANNQLKILFINYN